MRLRFAFQSKEKLYMVVDYMAGGELFFWLKKVRPTYSFFALLIVSLCAIHSHRTNYTSYKPKPSTRTHRPKPKKTHHPKNPTNTHTHRHPNLRTYTHEHDTQGKFSEPRAKLYAAEIACALEVGRWRLPFRR